MSRTMITIFTLIFFLTIPNLFATIINIREDLETIQAGMNEVVDGDHPDIVVFIRSDIRGVQISLKIPAMDAEQVAGEEPDV